MVPLMASIGGSSTTTDDFYAVEALIRCPFFSIRFPFSFQVRESMLLPAGTTLYGLLLNLLLKTSSELAERVPVATDPMQRYQGLQRVYDEMTKFISITSRVSSNTTIVSSPLVWKVYRFDRIPEIRNKIIGYDKIIDVIDRGELAETLLYEDVDKKSGKIVIKRQKITDAMIRSVTIINEFIISIVLPREISILDIFIGYNDIAKSLYELDRVGDSESLCSIIDLHTTRCIEIKHYREGDVIRDLDSVTILGGEEGERVLEPISTANSYAVSVKFNNPRLGLYRDKPSYSIYTLPLRGVVRRINGKHITVFEPSKYSLRVLKDGVRAAYYHSRLRDSQETVVHIYLPSYIDYLPLPEMKKTKTSYSRRKHRRSRKK